MATHDYIISNGTGTVIRADINNALSAIVTNNSSSSEPATKYAYMWWADTSAGLLKIRNSANDAWITLFQLDGTLTLEDGSSSAPALSFRDDTNTGIFSSAADNLDITTGGTTRVNVSSAGINVTGTVTDDGATHDGDVTFTGASANIIFDKSDNALEFADTSLARFGNSNDLAIYHSGSQSFIQDAGTGGLFILGSRVEIGNSGGSESGLVFTQNGSVDLYHNNVKVFETTSTGVAVTGGLTTTGTVSFNSTSDNVNFIGANYNALWNPASNFFRFNDNAKAIFGTGNDLEIYHDGINSYLKDAGTGVLRLSSNQVQVTNAAASEVLANFIEDGAVELYFDNSKKFETNTNGVQFFGQIKGADNADLLLGNSSDLQLYHDGTDSYIQNLTNDLFIDNNGDDIVIRTVDTIFFQVNNTENTITAKANGAVELYYDNVKKLETTSTGIKVIQDVVMDVAGDTAIRWANNGTNKWSIFNNTSASDALTIFDNNGSGTAAKFLTNGAVELYYDNNKKLETTSTGATVTGSLGIGTTTVPELLSIAADAPCGISILDTGHGYAATTLKVGNLGRDFSITAPEDITLKPASGEDGLTVKNNGAVEAYYDNVKRLETTSFGCTVQGGITFGSDTAAANQLDDYEEGVFTPSLEFGGATTGITYSSARGGSYTKIGRQVTVNFGFTLTSKGSASGDATLAGLPFAVEDIISGTSVEASGVSSFWNDVATDSANIVFAATNSSSELQIRHTIGAEDDTDDMTEGDFENNTALRGSITYFTAT